MSMRRTQVRHSNTKYRHVIQVVLITEDPRKSDIIEDVQSKLGPECKSVEVGILNIVEME